MPDIAVLVVALAVLLWSEFRWRKIRAKKEELGFPGFDGRYRVVLGGSPFYTNDSAEASKLIKRARERGYRWKLYHDGVLKKQG